MTNPLPKILLVDDNAINRKLYRHILAALAAEVVEVSSGAEALQAGTQNDFALVVLDCSMPEMDGFETARRLRALSRSSRVPIIFFTAAYTSPAEIREGYKLGAVDYLLKSPENSDLLVQKARVFLELEIGRIAQEGLRRNDQHLRSIIDSVHDYAIYLLDCAGSVMTWNAGAERVAQYKAEEIVGLSFSRFFAQEDLDRGGPEELLRIAASRGRVENEGWRVRKDGSRFWGNNILTAIRDATGAVTNFTNVTRDITDRKQADDALMLQLSGALLSTTDINSLLTVISATIREVIPHDCATLGLPDPAADQLIIQFLGAGEETKPTDVRIPLGGSPASQAFHSREPVVLDRIADADYSGESIQHLTKLGITSGCWVPLIHRSEPIGTMMTGRIEGAFSLREAEILARIASQVAVAVNNTMVFRQIVEMHDRLTQEKKYLEDEINLENRFDDIVGKSRGLLEVLTQIETVAATDATVLIQGETGTGKELLARSIHRLSRRSHKTFIKINCAAVPSALLESELFGYEKGAFTGAIARKVGRLELAHEGTLFLDEVGELPLDLQPKLLRALQEREVERLGGTRPVKVDVRLIAASNRDLAKMVAEKQFRSDLYYRLKVFPILAPPLRERISDIPILVRHFVATHSRRMGKVIESIPDEAMRALVRWPWPGNIRELENFLERAVILTRGPSLFVPLAELSIEDDGAVPNTETLQTAEREHILRVLREVGGRIGGAKGAAAQLGVKRTTLNSKLKKFGIERTDYGKE